jgi:hypothetical protein
MIRLLAILLLLASPAWGAEWYIATDGTDPVGVCSGGTSESPWKTWRVPKGLACISAGDTVYFKAGTYSSDNTNGIWEQTGSLKHRITAPGTSVVTISKAPDLALGDVKFEGPIEVLGSHITFNGIEFYFSEALRVSSGQKTLLSLWASNATVQNCHVHGESADVSLTTLPATSYDCIKIEDGIATGTRPENIYILNNTIANCSEQAIDSVGAKGVEIRRNYITNFWSENVKGGSENVVYDRNKFYLARYGIIGGSMSCTGAYCGNPELQTAQVDDRFVAKNVTITNNIFDTVTYEPIGPRGWKTAYIYHNTAVNGAGGLYVGASTLDFYDSIAATWCGSHSCTSCGTGCYTISFDSSGIIFRNNILSVSWQAVHYDTASASGVTADHNLYYRSGTTNIFQLDSTTYTWAYWTDTLGYESSETSINADPLLSISGGSTYYPASNSPAVNAGANVGVTSDYRGIPRPIGAGFDIGAIEFFTGTHFGGGVTASGVSF